MAVGGPLAARRRLLGRSGAWPPKAALDAQTGEAAARAAPGGGDRWSGRFPGRDYPDSGGDFYRVDGNGESEVRGTGGGLLTEGP